jgi:putative ATP-binding cassette transporter
MRLFSFLLRYAPGKLVIAVTAGIISGASNTGLLAVFNSALVGHRSKTALVWSFVALCILLPTSRYVSEILLAHLSQGALFDLRVRLATQVLAAPLRHLEELGPHRVMSALAEDVPVITGTLVSIPLLCINTAVVLGALIYLGLLSFKVLLGMLCFMALGIATYQIPVVRAMRWFRLAREVGDKLYSQFRDLTEGAKELKLHGKRRRAFLLDVFRPTADTFRKHSIAAITVYTGAASWGQILAFVVIGLIIFVLPSISHVSEAALFGYTLTLLYIINPLQVVLNTVPNLTRASVALRKIDQLGVELISAGSEEALSEGLAGDKKWDLVELKGVTHSYYSEGEVDSFILGPVDLTICPGQLIFIIGGNGSGKTTLAKLIVGLYSPESGEVRLNGSAVAKDRVEDYREHFSMVFSDFHLFDALLGIGDSDINDRALQYLIKLRLENKVTVNDGRLSTTSLSQGQRKRLALLTAYLEDRPIYIFDEWAADQDPSFKNVFYRDLLPELKARGKTILVITHDDHYYNLADRIIKLEYGKIEYDGPVASFEINAFSRPATSAAAENS